jgi:hypothetical protein
MLAGKKYELDWTRIHDNHHHLVIAVLTGHSIEDIIAASPTYDSWAPRDYINTFRKLGFNTNNRFIKFNPETPYPCLMRYTRTDIDEPYWYGSVYYDHKVDEGSARWAFDNWLKYHNGTIRVTSMLQVWI